MAMTIKVNGAVFEFDEVSEYLEFAEATGLEGLPEEEEGSGTPIKEPLGKGANGEDLYEGDYVTGSEGNTYAYTDDTVVMEVVGVGESHFFEEANIQVKIDGDWTEYSVISSKFVKLSDNLDEAKAKFDEIKGVEVGDFPTEPEDGDLVKVTATFEDDHGDEVEVGTICEYEDWGCSTIFIGSVLLGHNHDKIKLVCRREDRKDIDL